MQTGASARAPSPGTGTSLGGWVDEHGYHAPAEVDGWWSDGWVLIQDPYTHYTGFSDPNWLAAWNSGRPNYRLAVPAVDSLDGREHRRHLEGGSHLHPLHRMVHVARGLRSDRLLRQLVAQRGRSADPAAERSVLLLAASRRGVRVLSRRLSLKPCLPLTQGTRGTTRKRSRPSRVRTSRERGRSTRPSRRSRTAPPTSTRVVGHTTAPNWSPEFEFTTGCRSARCVAWDPVQSEWMLLYTDGGGLTHLEVTLGLGPRRRGRLGVDRNGLLSGVSRVLRRGHLRSRNRGALLGRHHDRDGREQQLRDLALERERVERRARSLDLGDGHGDLLRQRSRGARWLRDSRCLRELRGGLLHRRVDQRLRYLGQRGERSPAEASSFRRARAQASGS